MTPDSPAFFLSGDVMLGRGIDQVLPHPVPPHLFEPYLRSALGYVELAERASGALPRLVDAGAADVLHGHTSHHPRGIELYRGRAILYGCSDFLIDYEGIGGDGAYRPELCLMVFVTLEGEGGPARELQVTAAVT